MTTTNILPRRHDPFARPSPHPHRVIWLASLSIGISAAIVSLSGKTEPPVSLRMSAEPASTAPGLKQSCTAGDAIACNDLGVSLLNGYGVPVDDALAFQAFEHSCKYGSPDGCSNLGALYERGIGVGGSVERALELYERACTGGAALGCSNLGALYAHGRGAPHDVAEARRLFRQACDTGSARGCSNLDQLEQR